MSTTPEVNDEDSLFGPSVAFVGLAVIVGAIGLWLAIWADRDPKNTDAFREIGGALIAGAVLAVLVALYQELLEKRRDRRQDRREDEAAINSYRRELDLRLVNLLFVDAGTQRHWAADFASDAKKRGWHQANQAWSKQIFTSEPAKFDRRDRLYETLQTAGAVAYLLGEDDLWNLILDYSNLHTHFASDPGGITDMATFWDERLEAERAGWRLVSTWLEVHQRARYPFLPPMQLESTREAGGEG